MSPKLFDFFCSKCGHTQMDVICSTSQDACVCVKCKVPMEKDFSGFRGIHSDSNLRLSATRKKGKYKYSKAEEISPRRRPAKRSKAPKKIKKDKPYIVRGE